MKICLDLNKFSINQNLRTHKIVEFGEHDHMLEIRLLFIAELLSLLKLLRRWLSGSESHVLLLLAVHLFL